MAQTTGERYRVAPVHRRGREWPFPLDLYQTAVGRKWVMALTGIGLIGFVLAHMVGNLHVYEGPARMHEYADGAQRPSVVAVHQRDEIGSPSGLGAARFG